MSRRTSRRTHSHLIGAAVSAAALSLVAVGCSNDKGTSSTSAAATTDAPASTAAPSTTVSPGSTEMPATTADAGLSAKLLTAVDLGPAWEVGEPINEMDLTMNAELCKDVVMDIEMAARLNGEVGIQFQPVDRSSKHLMVQILTGEQAQLTTDLDGYFEAMKTCPVDPAGKDGAFLSITDIAVPALGDQVHALAIKAQEPGNGAVWFVRVIQVRVGGLAVGLGLTEVLTSATAAAGVSDAELIGWAEKAVAKLSA